jgi:hypothetical protein
MKDHKFILIDNERFYYDEVELFHGRKKIDLNIAKENLFLFQSIMDRNNLTWGIFFGTLLGAVRERNFIEHDEDIDIYLLYEERDAFLRLLILFKSYGFDLVRYDGEILSLMRKNEYIDLYFFKRKLKLGFIKVRVFCNEYEYIAINLENPVRQSFLGLNISMPDNPESVVREIYGKNWKIPLINKHSEPNTVYKKISNSSILIKNLPFASRLEKVVKIILEKLGL